jgi:hypothetical protein
MKEFLTIYFYGIVVLVVAIIANATAKSIGVSTWFDFLSDIGQVKFLVKLKSLSLSSILFLFVLYPLLLGFSLVIAEKLLGK